MRLPEGLYSVLAAAAAVMLPHRMRTQHSYSAELQDAVDDDDWPALVRSGNRTAMRHLLMQSDMRGATQHRCSVRKPLLYQADASALASA